MYKNIVFPNRNVTAKLPNYNKTLQFLSERRENEILLVLVSTSVLIKFAFHFVIALECSVYICLDP